MHISFILSAELALILGVSLPLNSISQPQICTSVSVLGISATYLQHFFLDKNLPLERVDLSAPEVSFVRWPLVESLGGHCGGGDDHAALAATEQDLLGSEKRIFSNSI